MEGSSTPVEDLVQQLATRRRLDAIRALLGGVDARELRAVRVEPDVLDAIVAGVGDPDPKIRWWCLQLLDHVDDPRAVTAIVEGLDDPVPRVRRLAAHALGCVACKPSWDGALPPGVLDRLHDLAAHDENAKVRAAAELAWSGAACRVGSAGREAGRSA